MSAASEFHHITVEWRDGYPSYTFRCTAPTESLCHAVYDANVCSCEEYGASGIEDGRPWHGLAYDDSERRHSGTFDPAICNLHDWFDNSDECLVGRVTLPVAERWEGDYFLFDVTPTVTTAAPDEWQRITGVTVMDPDGWDRRAFEEDWARPLTRDEFLAKARMSTSIDPNGALR